MAARLVVTLPPSQIGDSALSFARNAQKRGAQLLEVRTDLHGPESVDITGLASALPLIVSERGKPVPRGWQDAATWLDRELAIAEQVSKSLISFHSPAELSPEDALALWQKTAPPEGALIKHVEPLGAPARGERLLRTQQLLGQHFGKQRVTVLATGPCALPFRCLLARQNALDYVALEAAWAAAPGQRLLADAVRERKGRPTSSRAAILGSSIAHSRSPRIHPQPFDRIDLPPDAPVGELVDALSPYYRGFAVTSPFKKVLAVHLGVPLPAINTLVRRGHGYDGENTDIEGARRVLERLGGSEPVTVLGDGGATVALRLAAEQLGRTLEVKRRAEISEPITRPCVWTWPPSVELPEALAFRQVPVAVIAYGPPARTLAEQIERRGGIPLKLGAAWLIAQARGQRRLWEAGT